MSAQYSVNIQSQYYDPNTHVKNKMTEFRLDKDKLFLPNLRVANLGYSTTSAKVVHRILGFEGCIKNIRLLDGATELDSLRFANRFLSFQNQLGTNQNKLCVASKLSGAACGYVLNSTDKVDHLTPPKSTSTTADNEELCCMIDLRRVFPLLNNLDHLDTSVFKQLKIQIEYEVNLARLGIANITAQALTINTPLLIADCVVNPVLAQKMRSSALKSVIWDVVEHDQMTVPSIVTQTDALDVADTAGHKQVVSAVINGFDNKYVGKMVVVKAYNDPAVGYDSTSKDILGLGAYNSPLYPKETFNIRKNGQFIFAGADGIANNGIRQHMLWQSWGNMVITPYAGSESVGRDYFDTAAVNSSGVSPLETGSKMSNLVGQSSYYGFTIEDRCSQLQFTFGKTGFRDTQANNPYNVALDLHIFGECRKQLNLSGGDYNIKYL